MPLYILSCTCIDSGNSTKRDVEDMFLRAADEAGESGAIDVGTVVHWGETLIPPIYHGVKQLIDEQ